MATKYLRYVILIFILIIVILFIILTNTSNNTVKTMKTADGLSLSISDDGQVTSLLINNQEIISKKGNNELLQIRDLSKANEVSQPNLIKNPGFESSLEMDNWIAAQSSPNIDVTVYKEHISSHSGNNSLEFRGLTSGKTGYAAYATSPIPVTSGDTYRVGAWLKSEQGYISTLEGNPPDLQMNLWRELKPSTGLYMVWLDAQNHPLDNPVLAVALVQNAENWRFIQREITVPYGVYGVQVAVVARLQGEESLWFDDVYFIQRPENTQRIVKKNTIETVGKNKIRQEIIFTDFQIRVDYQAYDTFIAIDGIVQNLVNEERAFDLTFSLPVAAHGWRFWDDAHTSREISSGIYDNAISAISNEWLPMSLYPYLGIENGHVGVALAQNPQIPQIVRLHYDANDETVCATIPLGISPQAVKLENTASFSLVLYCFDPAWGFRDVIAKYDGFFPEIFQTNFPFHNYSSGEQGTISSENQMNVLKELQQKKILILEYVMSEFWLPAILTSEHPERPTYFEVLDVVNSLALPLSEPWLETPRLSGGAQNDPRVNAEMVKALYHSGIINDNGDWQLKSIRIDAYPDEYWYAMWPSNLDPDLEQGWGRWIMNRRADPVLQVTEENGVHLDGFMIDNFMSFPAIDHRAEAIQNADYTLTYSPASYRPGVHNGFAMFEFLKDLRNHLDENWGGNRAISVNCWGLGHPNYLAQFIDYFGGESAFDAGSSKGSNWNSEILDYRRAVASSKLLGLSCFADNVSLDNAREFAALAKLYGVGISVSDKATGWENGAQELINETTALIRQYALAGWEPKTYAQADTPDIWIERYGDTLDEGVYFAVYNNNFSGESFELVLDAVHPGLPHYSLVHLRNIDTGEENPLDSNYSASISVDLKRTDVFQLVIE